MSSVNAQRIAASGTSMEASPPSAQPQANTLFHRSDLLVAAGAATVFTLLTAHVRWKRTDQLDEKIMASFQRLRWKPFARLMWLLSWPGFSPQSRLLPPGIAAVLWLSGRRRAGIYTFAAWGASFLGRAFKLAVRRPRPSSQRITIVPAKLDGLSFPSGHVLAYIGVYGFLHLLARSDHLPEPLAKPVRWITLLMLLGVGPSRIYEGHHWPSDVAASYLLGLGYLRLVWRHYLAGVSRSAPSREA
ncbi:MAG: phosphatase PAP2 family protein [Chloroflexi bacterium]|nr:phosphatase PAP2 family protein [Chloroflexota bacterium]